MIAARGLERRPSSRSDRACTRIPAGAMNLTRTIELITWYTEVQACRPPHTGLSWRS
ncbi:hypothetical protein DB30_06013 [Enhygromyxa salina]|uniref:Uncharacterized protein n=1 Tax=Enhygromyxa salina TaxID=215803 RepID=A0A0C2CZR4_9BACT|nr:hypothetical protein DB30_06013 [Enhygromyxa salina]